MTCFAALCLSLFTTQVQPPPNFLIVVIDDASWEEFQNLPLDTIQMLAPFGRSYSRFYVSPVCSPSRYQMQFGRYPHERLIGSALNVKTDTGAPTEDLSIAEYLGANGYATGFFGKWHINGQELPIQVSEAPRVQGYQVWRAGYPGNLSSHYQWSRFDDGVKTTTQQYSTLAVGEAFEAWWQATPGPKLASVCFFAPHEPFQLPPSELTHGLTFPSTERGRYEAALVGVDTMLGHLLSSIDLDSTYLFLLPDNGTPHQVPPPAALEQGYKLTPYEGGIRVPLWVFGPGIAAGVDDSLVQVCDLPSTLIELARLPKAPTGFQDSISFARTLFGAAQGTRPWALLQRFTPNGPAPLLTKDLWAIVRQDGYKLLRDDQGLQPKLRLYYLPSDPHEQQPLNLPSIKADLMALQKLALGPDWPY